MNAVDLRPQSDSLLSNLKMLLLLGLFFSLPTEVFSGALSLSKLDSLNEGIALKTHFHYLKDPDKRFSAQQLLQEQQSGAEPWFILSPDQRVRKLGWTAYWMSLTLKNDTQAFKRQLIVVPFPFIGNLQAFISNKSEITEHYRLGVQFPYIERPIKERYPMVPIDIPAGESRTILLRSKNAAGYPIESATLWDRAAYFEQPDRELAINSFYFGIGLIFIIYHLVIYGFSRDRDYLLYVGLVSVTLIQYFINRGFGYSLLWPTMSSWNITLNGACPSLLYLLSGWFSWSFLDLKIKSPVFSRFIVTMLYGIAATILVTLFLKPGLKTIPVFISLLLATVMFFSLWLASLYMWWKGDQNARNYNFAWSFYLFSWSTVVLYHMDIVPHFQGIEYSIVLGHITLMLLLSFALASKINQLAEQRSLALMENKAKSEFLAKMSHEIRNPMNGVLGMTELLLHTDLNAEQLRYSKLIKKSSNLLLNVINEILDYSKIEAGKLELEQAVMDLEEVVSDVIALFRVQNKSRGVQLIADITPGTPTQLIGDPMRLRQILVNLLSNAFKFTEVGEIRLNVKRVRKNLKETEERPVIYFSVTDTGIGIPTETQAKLFSAFKQADSSTTRQYGGTGLGLTICRQLIELMDGEIGVKSNPGKGATFWFSVPLSESHEKIEKFLVDETLLHNKRLLVVDDYATYAEALQQHARSWGMDARITCNGERALDILRACKTKQQTFDLIAVDLDMPGINGVELIRQIRQETLTPNTPCLLISATHTLPDKAFLAAAGINRAIAKPDTVSQLKAVFLNLLGAVSQEKKAEPQRSLELPDNLQILVAEDNDVNRLVIKGLLKSLGVTSTLVENGEQAVMLLQGNHDLYDLVFMDCEMPIMDGYQAVEAIRRMEMQYSLTKIPIVALSAHAVSEMVEKSLAAGMDDHLAKPVNAEALLKAIRNYCTESADQHVRNNKH